MSYQQFSIPPGILPELYKSHIVLVNEAGVEGKNPDNALKPEAEKPWFLGENNQHTVVVVNDASSVYLSEKHLAVLSKILSACKLNLADVAIVNLATANREMAEIKEKLKPRTCLFFGVNPSALLPFMFPQYKVQQYGECAYLWADSLEDLSQDTDEAKTVKRQLWNCLKDIFKV